MVEDLKNIVRCHGCLHYFVTHDRYRPYGCARFGFKTKSLPSQVVVESTGMQCAYYKTNPSVKALREKPRKKRPGEVNITG